MWHGLNNGRASEICQSQASPLLAINFTGFKINGILPDSMLFILLVPVIKDKAGKVGCLDNYRPIALASILSKVLKRILLDRVGGYVLFLDNHVCAMLLSKSKNIKYLGHCITDDYE